MKVQVEKNHYDFKSYLNSNRWMSYYYQIINALDDSINDILYVGAGDQIVADILKKSGKQVTTFDFAEDLKPDIVGSITDIKKILEKKYDCIMCCQVLEHLPFNEFENVISQMSEVSNKKVILSLPYHRRKILSVQLCLPKIHDIHFKWLIKRKEKNGFRFEVEGNNEHYWELDITDKKECSRKNVRKILEKYFTIEEEFNPIENTYHVFYILNSKKDN